MVERTSVAHDLANDRNENQDDFIRLQCLTSVNHEPRSVTSSAHSLNDLAATATPRLEGEPSPGYLDQDVSKFFYRWGGLLSSTLVRIRGRFQGDLDQYLIYLVFLLTELAQLVSAREAAAHGRPHRTPSRKGLNALSIADITRIPRETARRKLHALNASGYLVRDAEGLFYLGDRYGLDEFFNDLRPLFWDGIRTPAG